MKIVMFGEFMDAYVFTESDSFFFFLLEQTTMT